MKLRMPIKPLLNEDMIQETNLFRDPKSWFIKLCGFAQLDSNKFPPTEFKLAAEYSRDKDYLYVQQKIYIKYLFFRVYML
jgi:hypothetical protein